MADAFFLAAIASATLLMAQTAPENWMRGDYLRKEFAGRTITGTYRTGEAFTETYSTKGDIAYQDTTSSDTGSWTIRNDLLCTFYTELPGGCFRGAQESKNCYVFFLTDSSSGDVIMDAPWVQVWRTNEPSSCAPPAIS